MGSCMSLISSLSKEQNERSKEIDRYLEDERKKTQMLKLTKILLLGPGESGKSTILKQMKIIHLNGYSKDELVSYRNIVWGNILESIVNLINAIEKFGLEFTDPKNSQFSKQLKDIVDYSNADPTIDRNIGQMIKSVWTDDASRTAMERSNEFYMMDTAPDFFSEIDRIANTEYLPTENDVLKTRVRSTGITELAFSTERLNIRMYDVGGQRAERKKWIHCFEGVTSLIFVVSLSDYDQVLLEDETQNRMAESLVLFEAIVNSRWFLNSSFILFLNKIDLFKLKIRNNPLSNYFPEYAGGSDFGKAAKFMLWRFKQLNRQNLVVYPHLTCATDTQQISVVFSAVKDTLIKNFLKDSGIIL